MSEGFTHTRDTPPAGKSNSILDHFCINVTPNLYPTVITFYEATLASIGISKHLDYGVAAGFGTSAHDSPFWIAQREDAGEAKLHFAFQAKSHEEVVKWYDAAIKAGGKDNGKPGIREMYHPNYYAAFVVDPAGNNIEIVDHVAH
ncbi:Glyoxalase/Bleomycin resistance protein/Dihydroxybiphenyl dioxygenase [Lophiotrema nucula]|uniref:Glyoxalase/Bleomycin resistance protein/Dihydroxybiphenyl dioxygenase n=1 Tax=Lophiotrema nucula TaxID=690887 RepID=A0A6A5YS83_9PLEO|nr:Glyoxalase/Bleomycin resistance protein/Dihydroxybiphenyl dioxygenase [Lophiotrema nucula]